MKHTSDAFAAENTMRALQGKDPLYSKEEMIKKFQHYVATYEPHMTMDPETFMRDLMFGIGKSMCPEYDWAVGWLKFEGRIKEMIDAYLEKNEVTKR